VDPHTGERRPLTTTPGEVAGQPVTTVPLALDGIHAVFYIEEHELAAVAPLCTRANKSKFGFRVSCSGLRTSRAASVPFRVFRGHPIRDHSRRFAGISEFTRSNSSIEIRRLPWWSWRIQTWPLLWVATIVPSAWRHEVHESESPFQKARANGMALWRIEDEEPAEIANKSPKIR